MYAKAYIKGTSGSVIIFWCNPYVPRFNQKLLVQVRFCIQGPGIFKVDEVVIVVAVLHNSVMVPVEFAYLTLTLANVFL